MNKSLFKIASVLCAAFCGLTMVACSTGGESTTNENNNQNTEEEETSITFADFIANHSNKAVEFYREKFSALTSGKELLAETVSIGANSNDELNTLTAVYTYKVDDTHRKIEKVKATLSSPVDLDKIVDGTAGSVTYTPQIEEILLFDIQFIKENAELTEKLFSTVELNSNVKIFGEVAPAYGNTRTFHLLTYETNAYSVGEISVIVDDNTQENLMAHLQDPAKVVNYKQVETFPVKEEGQKTIISSEYDFASDTYTPAPVEPENPDQGGEGESGEGGGETEETIGSIAELIQNYNDEVYAALNETFLNRAAQRFTGKNTINSEDIIESKWDLGNNLEDTNLQEVKLIMTYIYGNGYNIYTIGTIEFKSAINLRECSKDDINQIINDSLMGAIYQTNYSFVYRVSDQSMHSDLVNAIFAACGHELTEGSTILFHDMGHILDSALNEAHGFKVAEITDKGVHEFTVRVKEALGDTGYINNLEEENGFIQSSQQSHKFSGNFVTKTEQKEDIATTTIL